MIVVVQGVLGGGFIVCWDRQSCFDVKFVTFSACNIGGIAVWRVVG